MVPLVSLGALLLARVATAKTCSNFSIPIEISSRQGVFADYSR